jgi:hypothetical protein
MRRQATDMEKKRRPTTSPLHSITAIVGVGLLVVALIWGLWLAFHPALRPNLSSLPLVGKLAPTAPAQSQIPALMAEGITLGHPSHTAALSQQQALLIAGELESDAATKAKSTSASYVLLNYPVGKAAAHANLTGVPVWMIVYQKIPRQPADASVEPTPLPLSYQNLVVRNYWLSGHKYFNYHLS